MEWYFYPLLLGAGFVAGYINTIAGSGSLLTLPALMLTGMPATVANGTNRLAILFQSISGSWGFYRKGKLPVRESLILSAPSVVGSLIGAALATSLTDQMLERIIGFLLLVMGLILFFNPKAEHRIPFKRPLIKTSAEWLTYIAIGFYGGFIQAGVGFFLLGGLTLVSGKDLMTSNAIKSMIVGVYTLFALAIFVYNKQVSLLPGMVLAAGSIAGAWVSSQTAVRMGVNYLRYILLTIIVAVSVWFIFF